MVLANVQNSKKNRVTWNTSVERVRETNEKARKRHMELVVARIMRDKRLMAMVARGLE